MSKGYVKVSRQELRNLYISNIDNLNSTYERECNRLYQQAIDILRRRRFFGILDPLWTDEFNPTIEQVKSMREVDAIRHTVIWLNELDHIRERHYEKLNAILQCLDTSKEFVWLTLEYYGTLKRIDAKQSEYNF